MPGKNLIPALCSLPLFLLVACGDSSSTGPKDDPPPFVDNTPAHLTAATSISLTGAVGSTLSAGVRVTTSSGTAVAGVSVQFSVLVGGGSAQGSVTTDAAGNATVSWQLGTA